MLLLLGASRFQLINGRLMFCHFSMVFQKLVQQHRVDRFVADGRDLRGQLPALPVADFSASSNVTRSYFPFPVTLRISL